MEKRIPVNDSNKATFICPKCQKTKTVDVSTFAYMCGTAKINAKCSCGYKWTSTFEKRKKFRKPVNFSGVYEHIKKNKIVDRGGMKVVDLSTGGAKIKLNVERDLQVGDNLNLEFHLDDENGTLINKRVRIQSINGVYISTTYGSPDMHDPDMGFYLMK